MPNQIQNESIHDIIGQFQELGYVADRPLATSLFLLMRLRKPLLIEGPAGVGKTEVAKVLARLRNTNLIRLQCYEGPRLGAPRSAACKDL